MAHRLIEKPATTFSGDARRDADAALDAGGVGGVFQAPLFKHGQGFGVVRLAGVADEFQPALVRDNSQEDQ